MKGELLTVLIGASPFFELEGAMPFAVFIWHFSVLKAFLLSTLGNLLPVIPLLLFWNFIAEKLADHFYYFNRLFAWLTDMTRKRHSWGFKKWESLALFIFVALPFPLTGVWTGTLMALVFGVPLKKAAIMIILGAIISGIIVSFFVQTGSNLLSVI
ncbi:MAG: small multi-drug export protein [Parcubacteria group bacterium]